MADSASTPAVSVQRVDRRTIASYAAVGGLATGHGFLTQDFANGCTVQVTGTYGAATLKVQGSTDGTNYTDLSETPGGSAISNTSAGQYRLVEPLPPYMRIVTSGGTATALAVTISGKNLR